MLRASSVTQSLDRMQRWMGLHGLAANSVDTYLRCARKFLAQVDRPLRAVTRRDVEDYLHTLVAAARRPSTRNVELSAIRCLLRAASRNASHRTRSAIASRRTCSTPALMCARCSSCLGTRIWRRPRRICTGRPRSYDRCRARSICSGRPTGPRLAEPWRCRVPAWARGTWRGKRRPSSGRGGSVIPARSGGGGSCVRSADACATTPICRQCKRDHPTSHVLSHQPLSVHRDWPRATPRAR
jgi:hypothetical protein